MEDKQEQYIRRVLDAYRKTTGTTGTVRRSGRLLAAQLHQRGVPVVVIENALILAAGRRLPVARLDSFAGLLSSPDRGSAQPACFTPITSDLCATKLNGPAKHVNLQG